MAQECCGTDEINKYNKTGTQQPGNKICHCEQDGNDPDSFPAENGNRVHGEKEAAGWISHWPLLSSLVILLVMLVLQFGFTYKPIFSIELFIYAFAFILAGHNVLLVAFENLNSCPNFHSVETRPAFDVKRLRDPTG